MRLWYGDARRFCAVPVAAPRRSVPYVPCPCPPTSTLMPRPRRRLRRLSARPSAALRCCRIRLHWPATTPRTRAIPPTDAGFTMKLSAGFRLVLLLKGKVRPRDTCRTFLPRASRLARARAARRSATFSVKSGATECTLTIGGTGGPGIMLWAVVSAAHSHGARKVRYLLKGPCRW